ncbi:MAG: multinuclear nonheme iron-dependent oxidase, partial [Methylococcales bacterium]
IYVSAFNHGFDPCEYLEKVPAHRVWQFHLAGHLNLGKTIIDTHDHAIIEPVWNLYEQAVERFGTVSTMIERDDKIPALEVLLAELEMARQVAARVKLTA